MECSACGGSVRPSNGFWVCQQCGLCHDHDYQARQDPGGQSSHQVLATVGTVVGCSPETQRLRQRQKESTRNDRWRRLYWRVMRTGQQLGLSKTQLKHATRLAGQLLRQVPRGEAQKLGLAVLCIVARQYRLPLGFRQLLDAYSQQGARMKPRDLMRFLLEHPIRAWIPPRRDWSIYLPEAVDVAVRHLQTRISSRDPPMSELALRGIRSHLQDLAHQLLTELSSASVTKALVAAAVYAACQQSRLPVPEHAWATTGLRTYTLRMAWTQHFKPQMVEQNG